MKNAELMSRLATREKNVQHDVNCLLTEWTTEEEGHWMPTDVMDLSIALADAVGLRLDMFAEHMQTVASERDAAAK